VLVQRDVPLVVVPHRVLGLRLFVPPFGVGFFIACALGRTSVEAAARAYVPYVIALLLGLLLVAFVPWITLVVPRLMKL
jgi:TRAP-type C4-dicarboxylate transport system permease large subunit